jgi:hypothetical protein
MSGSAYGDWRYSTSSVKRWAMASASPARHAAS